MPLDANGIWQYTEAETGVAPFSTFLNKLAASISNKIGPLLVDSGWVALTLKAGFGGTLSVRLRGNRVQLRGLVTPNTSWAGGMADNQIVDSLPATYHPVGAHVEICASASIADGTVFRVASSGAIISVRSATGGGYTPGVYINYDYLKD